MGMVAFLSASRTLPTNASAWPDRSRVSIESAATSERKWAIQSKFAWAATARQAPGFSKSLKLIGDKLEAQFGNNIAVEYVFNIMDHGHKAEDILTLVVDGSMTLGYQSRRVI